MGFIPEKIEILAPKIKQIAKENAVNPALLAAIIYQESAGNLYAMRYEPRWTSFKDTFLYSKLNKITEATETQLQSFSYGLCQIMGSVFREKLGFVDELPKVLDVDFNIQSGAKILHLLTTQYPYLEDAISAYNQGTPRKDPMSGLYRNQGYVDNVLKYMGQFRELFG